jgi:hypothetical protein
MKIYAKDVLAQKYPLKYKDPLAGGPNRASKLAELEETAMAFAVSIFASMETPTEPLVRLGNMKGFEDITKDLDEVSGTVMVHCAFNADSGHTVRIDLPIPVRGGQFYKPSIMIIDSKKAVFSQGALNKLLANFQFTKSKTENLFSPRYTITHEEVKNKDVFQVPPDMVSWHEGY